MLTAKEEAFALAYAKDSNATQAAIIAGYAEKSAYVTGSKLLKKDKVKLRIEQIRAKAAKAVGITVERWLEEVTTLALMDYRTFGTVEPGGNFRVHAFEDLLAGATRCIKKIKQKRTIKETKDEGSDIIVDDNLEFELHDKNKALEMLGRYFGAFNDKLKLDASEVLEVFDRIRERRGSR